MAFLLGCGGDGSPKTYTVSGTVSYDGKPVDKGSILFRQVGGEGRGYSAEIKDGKYEVKLEAGEMSVTITGSRETGKMIKDENGETVPQVVMYIPKKYNDATTLKTTIKPESQTIPFDLAK
jgi:hypothetical protein